MTKYEYQGKLYSHFADLVNAYFADNKFYPTSAYLESKETYGSCLHYSKPKQWVSKMKTQKGN